MALFDPELAKEEGWVAIVRIGPTSG